MEALQQKIEGLEEQVRLLETHVSQLQLQLKAAGQESVEYMTLDEAKAKMQAAVERLMQGDLKAEKELEKLDKAMKLHPDYIKEEEEKAARWEAEQQPKWQEALKNMRGFIPPDIMNLSKRELIEKGVPKEIAARVFSKKVLWFVRKDPRDIAKTHQADLISNYTSQGLDIVEMRAVYAVLPEEFELDSDEKVKWKHNFKQKMLELSTKEEGNRLMANEKRHNSYRKHMNVKPIFDATTVKVAATMACTAFEPTKKPAQRSANEKYTHLRFVETDDLDESDDLDEDLDTVSIVAVSNEPTRR